MGETDPECPRKSAQPADEHDGKDGPEPVRGMCGDVSVTCGRVDSESIVMAGDELKHGAREKKERQTGFIRGAVERGQC